MARTTEDLRKIMLGRIAQEPTLAAQLVNISSTAIYKLWIYITAYVLNTFENVLDAFTSDMENKLKSLKPHTLYWYTQKAKNFQYGYNLPLFEENYDNTGLMADAIAQSKIITQAACTRSLRLTGRPYLRLKVARGETPNLSPLDPTQLAAVRDYIAQIQDAGVDVEVESNDADEIVMQWSIWYNPQLIDQLGNSLSTGEPVVINAIKLYLQNLPFNGRYVPEHHKAFVYDSIEGVEVADIEAVTFKTYGTNLITSPPPSGAIPDAGWLKFYTQNALTLTLIPHES